MTTMKSSLGVFVGGTQTGNLSRHGDGDYLFRRLGGDDDPAVVSLAWPEAEAEFLSPRGVLHPVFDQCLPEGALKRHLQDAFFGTLRNKDDMTLLRIVGSSLIGRLRFAENQDSLRSVPPIDIRSEILKSSSGEVLKSLLERYAQFSGVAGVQPKFLLRDEAVQNDHTLTLQGATHIVKTFDAAEYPALALNEFVCLQAAAKAGLAIPNVEVSDDGRWLSVERFDLVHAEAESRYIAFEDMCSLTGRTSAQKYDGSCELIAARLRDFSSVFHDDARQFFTMLVLNCVMRNADAHLKNFGLLYDTRGDVRLAPAFDVTCTEVYPEIERRMALRLDGMDTWPDAPRLERFGVEHCMVEPGAVRGIISRVSDAAIESLALLNDARMPQTTARLMRFAVESGVASMQTTQRRRNSAPAEQPTSSLAETAKDFADQLPIQREPEEDGPVAS